MVLEKYDYKLPTISSQRFNEYIREACEEAGIDEMVLITYSEKDRVQSERVEKHEYVTSHAARRSFATNFFNDKILKIGEIQNIFGHSSQTTTWGYILVDTDKIQEQASTKLDAWGKEWIEKREEKERKKENKLRIERA